MIAATVNAVAPSAFHESCVSSTTTHTVAARNAIRMERAGERSESIGFTAIALAEARVHGQAGTDRADDRGGRNESDRE